MRIIRALLCRIGIHTNTSITACMTKHCFNCGKSLGHMNEKKERKGERRMSKEVCICDYCVYNETCDASSMCEECEEFEKEEIEQ